MNNLGGSRGRGIARAQIVGNLFDGSLITAMRWRGAFFRPDFMDVNCDSGNALNALGLNWFLMRTPSESVVVEFYEMLRKFAGFFF